MAGNYGKYIDRSPIICAAGKVSGDPNDTLAKCLQQYRIEDEIEAIKHDAKIWQEDVFVPPRKPPPFQNAEFRGTDTEAREALNPPVMTRYQRLIMDLKETPYSSYWNAQLGKSRDPNSGLPRGMDPVETTFGEPSVRGTPVRELVNPPKSHYEVLRDSQIGHEMYKKTHKDYNPSERIDRGYLPPSFNPNQCFGGKSKYDPRGLGTKCAVNWHENEPLVHANKYQADFRKRTQHPLGRALAPNDNINSVPKGHAFGRPSVQDFYKIPDLLKDPAVKPCVFKRDYHDWQSSLNKTKFLLKEKCSKGYSLEDVYKKALNKDIDKTGYIPIGSLFQLFACDHVRFSKNLEYLAHHLGYIIDGKINYRKFIDLININKLEETIQIDDIPKESQYYMSTSQAASCDYLFIDNTDSPAAGISSVRSDLPRPSVPETCCRADLENLGNETSAKAVMNPSIYTNFGLTYRDFFLPRSAEFIKSLFGKIGHNFSGDKFDRLWKMGLENDQTGGVCVDTFKKLLNNQCRITNFRVDEKQIECEK